MPNVVLMCEAIRRFTSYRITLISQFAVAMNGMVAAPLQFIADRSFAGAGKALNQIISLAHYQMITNMGLVTCQPERPHSDGLFWAPPPVGSGGEFVKQGADAFVDLVADGPDDVEGCNWRRRVFDPAITAAGLSELTPHELGTRQRASPWRRRQREGRAADVGTCQRSDDPRRVLRPVRRRPRRRR